MNHIKHFNIFESSESDYDFIVNYLKQNVNWGIYDIIVESLTDLTDSGYVCKVEAHFEKFGFGITTFYRNYMNTSNDSDMEGWCLNKGSDYNSLRKEINRIINSTSTSKSVVSFDARITFDVTCTLPNNTVDEIIPVKLLDMCSKIERKYDNDPKFSCSSFSNSGGMVFRQDLG